MSLNCWLLWALACTPLSPGTCCFLSAPWDTVLQSEEQASVSAQWMSLWHRWGRCVCSSHCWPGFSGLPDTPLAVFLLIHSLVFE